MMDKSGNQLGLKPVASINPVTSIAGIRQAAEALGSKQQNISQHQATLLSNGLQKNLSGQSTPLVSVAELSPLGRLINQSLQQAANKNTSNAAIVQQLVTTNPKQTQQFAQALNQVISRSGLFYESHLADAIDGQRSLSSLKLEPQMQSQQAAFTLLPQQLNLLDHPRISWHGEVWPNQLMEWHIQLPEQAADRQASADRDQSAQMITTELSLSLPKLGKVRAQIHFVNGKVQLQVNAENPDVCAHLKLHGPTLTSAIERNGQILEAMRIQSTSEEGHA